MDFWIFVAVILGLVMAYPFIRCFCKRMSCQNKIKKICKRKNYVLHKTHTLWFLGRKNGKNCDCYIETPTQIFSVKLFAVKRRKKKIVLQEGGTYFYRRYFFFASRKGALAGSLVQSIDGKLKTMQEYNFRYKLKEEWESKNLRNVLLINPVPIEILYRKYHDSERIAGSGDVINGMEFWSFSGINDLFSDEM